MNRAVCNEGQEALCRWKNDYEVYIHAEKNVSRVS